MSNDDKKTKAAPPKKEAVAEAKTAPATESKTAEAVSKVDGVKAEGVKPDAAPSRQGMGEGQKPVSQAYKDNWNAIFASKKKKKR